MQQGTKIGFIGLGAMGIGMAASLCRARFAVTGHDLREEALARLVERGGARATTPEDAARGAQLLFVMVLNDAQVEAVLFRPNGLLETMTAGTVMVCSTIALSELLPIAERARARGVTVIDTPVSGGVSGANAGTLTLLCGGDAAEVAAQRRTSTR